MKLRHVFVSVAMLTALMLTVPTFVQCSADTPSGSGTSSDPYQIATLNNLHWITQNSSSWSGYFIQTADIDASSSYTWASGAGFSPIGNSATQFTGSYDGKTYKITGLYIYQSSTNYIGFFGYTSGATITNVKIESVSITGDNYTGGLIGEQYGGTTTSCYSTGSVTGNYDVGGLIGLGNSSSIESNCYSTSSVKGYGSYVGGLMGAQVNSTATNCYCTGSVTGNLSFGGFIGFNLAVLLRIVFGI